MFWSEDLVVKETFSEKLLAVVRILTSIVAAGAKTKAQIKKIIKRTRAIAPMIIHLRYFSRAGTFFLPFLPFLSSFSKSSEVKSWEDLPALDLADWFFDDVDFLLPEAPWEPSWAEDLLAELPAASEPGSLSSKSASLITCSPRSGVASIISEGSFGRDCRVLATGICAAAASLVSEESPETITTVLPAVWAALATSLVLTALRRTPIFLGGTRATTFWLAFLIRAMISVISSSGSI